MKVYQTSFSGHMLERGFWLYIWRIRHKNKSEYWYIGRTGDSSSANASSPLARLSQHLNLKPNAKGNTLIKNIKKEGLNPKECKYKLASFGPVFPEQNTFPEHVPFRDIVARIEAEIAHEFKRKGLIVLGNHPARGDYDKVLFNKIIGCFNEAFGC